MSSQTHNIVSLVTDCLVAAVYLYWVTKQYGPDVPWIERGWFFVFLAFFLIAIGSDIAIIMIEDTGVTRWLNIAPMIFAVFGLMYAWLNVTFCTRGESHFGFALVFVLTTASIIFHVQGVLQWNVIDF